MLQGALYVYCIGYAMKGGSSPLLVPITLQPLNGNAITVQSDASRPADADAVITLFSSDKLNPLETYTITVTKTSTTLGNDLNVDAFILTQLHEVATTSSSPGIDFLVRLSRSLILLFAPLRSSNDHH